MTIQELNNKLSEIDSNLDDILTELEETSLETNSVYGSAVTGTLANSIISLIHEIVKKTI